MSTAGASPAGEQVLPEMPRLGRLYSRAAGRSGMLMLSRAPLRGSTVPELSYRVDGVRADAADLSAYQHLLGEPGTDVLPAGYVHVLAFPLAMALMVREDFPLPVLGMVHTANRVVQHRQVLLTEDLTVRARAGNARRHRKGTQVDLSVTAHVGDQLVWEGVSTYLAKGRTLPGLPEADGNHAGPERRGPAEETGAAPRTASWRLTPSVAKEYAEISGDHNPIHVSRVGARLLGFPRPIAHGMYTAARALAAVGPARGKRFVWEVDFGKPVLLPGRVDLAVTVDQDGGHHFVGRSPRSGAVHLSGVVGPR
ncbi:MaoC/PaaZ C-terminal domain-containing protein [Georgenia sp. 10Sc9-8]|uniref:MaoC/PaaZ C-terminal domain-containing protein n=1 Tax=Georgenia halotolerans TaxID=3028317 RepID=A0ABT5TVF3_9MICO|nr:MaoC/PaaZ C-terminal domain-containing protein [Georgenia halotolerans]